MTDSGNIPDPAEQIVAKRKGFSCWACILPSCLLTITLLILIAVAVPIVFISPWLAEGERQLNTEVALLASSGDPGTPEELEAYYQLPAGADDATDLWTQSVLLLDTEEFNGDAEMVLHGNFSAPGIPWDNLEEARRLLAKHRRFLDGLHTAAGRGAAARYESEFDAGLAQNLRVFRGHGNAARMLKLEAYVKAHGGDSAGALRSIRTLFALAESIGGFPQILPQIVRVAIEGVAFDTLSVLLPSLEASDATLSALMDELASHDFDQGIRNGLLGDRINGLHAFDHPEVAADDLPNPEQVRQLSEMWLKRDRAYYLQQMRQLVELSDDPWPHKLDAAKQVDLDLKRRLEEGRLKRFQYIYSTLLLPPGETFFATMARAHAMRELARVALAIERYRRQNDTVPEELSQLVPEYLNTVPLDPFDGQQLRYRIEDEQYLVYSIGMDRIDSGGDRSEHRPDVVFAVEANHRGR